MPTTPDPKRPRLYAHRGASAEAPENTLLSFRTALDIPGVDALELDVHTTRDGHPIVSHDASALRMANRKVNWKDIDLAEARALDVGWGFVAPDGSRPFAGRGIRVPTFEEVLAEFPGVPLNVDIKQVWPPMAGRLVRLLRERRAEERVILASFHHLPLLAVRARRYPGPTALSPLEMLSLASMPRWAVARAPLFGTCAQIPEKAGPFHFARAPFIDACHALGLRVDFWTINDPKRAQELLDLGADGVMTDDPRTVATIFRKRQEP